MLLCVDDPSLSFGLEDTWGADDTGVVVVVGFRAIASRSLSLSPAKDSDRSEGDDDWSMSDGVTLDIVVMVGVAEVGVAPASRSRGSDEVRASCKASRLEVDASSGDPPLEVVVLLKTKRLISFFKNRGLSKSSRGCAGAAAAKHVAESSVDSNARDATKITEDLRNIMEVEYARQIDLIIRIDWGCM